jgi:hypothetical protein
MAQTRIETKADPVALAAQLRPLLARNASQSSAIGVFATKTPKRLRRPTCSR